MAAPTQEFAAISGILLECSAPETIRRLDFVCERVSIFRGGAMRRQPHSRVGRSTLICRRVAASIFKTISFGLSFRNSSRHSRRLTRTWSNV
jgi:hypothetical protein